MSSIEKDFTYIGYPCFAKIANQLNNAAEIPEYTAFALSVLKTDNIPNAELLVSAQEGNLLPDSPIQNTDFLCYKEGITQENVFDTLMSEPRIKKYNNCTKYYRKFDNRLSLCKVCPRSPYYRNWYINEEYALLKFVLSDRSNMQYFKELLKKYPSFRFMVSEDLALEYRTKNTYVYESNTIFFECLKKHEDILYYSYNNYTIILKTSFSKMVKEGRRLPNTISQRDNWSLVAIDKILSRIDRAKDYSREEAEQFLTRFCEEEKERKVQIETYESRMADSAAGVSTAIKNFAPKVKKEKAAGQKKTNKITESSDKKKEEKETPPFDPRNFVKFPDDMDDFNEPEGTDTENPVNDEFADKKEQSPTPTHALSENMNTEIKQSAEPEKEDLAPERTDEVNYPAIPETVPDIQISKEPEDIQDGIEGSSTDAGDTTEGNGNNEENNAETLACPEEEMITEEYTDDDLIFQMYHSNIEEFCEEPEEEYKYTDDYTMQESTEEFYDIEYADTDETVRTEQTEPFLEQTECDRENTVIADADMEDAEPGFTNTSLVVRKQPASVALHKKKIYPDMEEFDDTLPYRELTLPPMEKQLCLEPVITEELLEQCIPIKDDLILLATLETAILKERYFCMELVKDNKGNELFLFYIHKLHRYYYTRLDSKKVRDVFIPLFKMPSVKKYCYLPFYIYGYCACKEIKIRSLESIYTTQSCSKEDKSLSLGDLCVKYMPYGQQALKKALENASPHQWFYGIAYYRTIISKAKTDEKKLRDTNALNEVFGTSYLAKQCFHTQDRLFALNTDGTLTFHNERYAEWVKKVRVPGYSVRYTVSAEKQTQQESIYSLLILLSVKGYFKNRSIRLIAFSNTTARFYIGKDDFAYLDTVIQTHLFRFGRTIEEYHTDVSYEYHTP